MTPLPKHLEEMRDELVSKRAFSITGNKNKSKADWEVEDNVLYGFNQAAFILLKDMESMAKALEIAGNACGIAATFLAFHGRPSAQLQNCIDNMKKQEEISLEALEIWREKYKGEGL